MYISPKQLWTVFWSWVAEEAFINILGAREMIPELIMAVVPIIGATAATLALFGAIDLLRDWDRRRAQKEIVDLERVASSGDSVFTGSVPTAFPEWTSINFWFSLRNTGTGP